MLWYRKQELYLGQFTNLILQSILRSNIVDSFHDDGSLSPTEVEKFKREVLFLRVEFLMVQLMDKRKFGNTEFSNKEIGETVGSAFVFAMNETEASESDVDEQLELLIDRIDRYEKWISSKVELEASVKEICFQILQYFTILVLGDDDERAKTEEGRNKGFVVFSYGNQIYRLDRGNFENVYSKTKFLD